MFDIVYGQRGKQFNMFPLPCLFRREHLSQDDLQKNKAIIEHLSKGQLMDNCDVSSMSNFSWHC